MKSLRAAFTRVIGLFRPKRREAEMNEELRSHLDGLIERNVAAGMPPAEARFAALRAFGGVAQIAERTRDERRSAWVENLFQDLRYAGRQLRKHPGFTVVAALSLALGIGVNTANFSLVNELFLTALPVKDPERLVLFQYTPSARGSTLQSVVSDLGGARTLALPTLEWARAEQGLVADVFAMAGEWTLNVNIDGQAELVPIGQVVSGNYHAALGIPAALGRTLAPDDDRPGAAPVAVISHRYWRTRFEGNPAVLGRSILVNRTPVTIVGVTPPEFLGTMLEVGVTDITLPLSLAPSVRSDGPDVWKSEHVWLRVMARLRPGVTVEQARAGLEAGFQASMRDALVDPNDMPRLRLEPAGAGRLESNREHQRVFFRVASGIVALVLLSACANVANLLLARGATRRREIAMRMALGASRGRIVRQLLTESTLVALLGAAAGLLVARWSVQLLSAGLVLDGRVLGFATALALLTGIGFGLVPALRATRLDLTTEFQGGSRSLGGGRSRLNQGLLVAQVAISFVLLVGAGLFMRTLRNLQAVDAGFNLDRLLLFSIDASSAGHRDGPAFVRIHGEILNGVARLPGVQSAALAAWPFLSNAGEQVRIFSVPGKERGTVTVNTVSPDFFTTLQMPILLGRGFTPHDHATAPAVVVVNEAFARKYFETPNPVGRSFRLDGATWEVVGVARDVKQRHLRETTQPLVFIPFLRQNFGHAHYAIRTAGDPAAMIAAIRRTVGAVDRNLLVTHVRTQADVVANNVLGGERFYTRISLSLGLSALALACIGLYGLLSHLVLRRTGEIGLRMALGARPGSVLRMIQRESLALVVAGVALGVAGAGAAARLVAKQLYGLSPTDPLTYGAVALLLIAVALLATLLPARLAAKIDPMVALRTE